MELVLATHGLAGIGGSETYLWAVAEQLQRLGHGVTVHAATGGAMSEFMAGRGVPVAIGERGLPEVCDAILVQDAGMAYALADRWPGTPQLFRAPSALHDFQLPPQLPGVAAAVVVCSDRMLEHVSALGGEREIVRLRHPVDTQRLAPRGGDPRAPAPRGAPRQLRERAPPRSARRDLGRGRGGLRERRHPRRRHP